ncbi:hypothetical protein F975_02823 [Acinetobacter sp. ANC 3789]|uniref:hypothetical protein n=1 Tax=Acinetobacter sp. ANC 3789 TaxID=1217714 RepID=UPI0002CF2A73|nr:hypothetical protein [Acinetobacter sp. ANC 3789]ENU79572.1 hypothetical protein F975_02823 [Acinetobacter sp. ANC 3789]
MNKWAIAASLVIGMVLTGCATTVKPSYVSPTQYQALNCTQLQSEYDRIQHYLEQGVEPEKRTGVGVGVGGGWGRSGWGFGPTFSVNLGQSSNTKRSEIAQLMGQQDAIVQAAHFKNCRILTVKRS